MDGTILDTEPTHRKAWNEVLGRYGMRFDDAGDGRAQWLSNLADCPGDYRTESG
jgi:beta-phosphoglucomutase-like phosphatase (HAD superfamily)